MATAMATMAMVNADIDERRQNEGGHHYDYDAQSQNILKRSEMQQKVVLTY